MMMILDQDGFNGAGASVSLLSITLAFITSQKCPNKVSQFVFMKRIRYPKSWSKHNLPVELWSEILSRLPVKSLLRFRCVSKSWQSLIGDPNFCQLHLKNFMNNYDETHLFVTQSERLEKESNVVRCGNTFKTKVRLDSLYTIYGDSERWIVCCSIAGLVMLRQRQYPQTRVLILWNPSIRKTRPLPPSPPIPEGLENVDLDIGFDPLVNDYKLVRIVISGDSSIHSVAIYTLGTGLWKTIQPKGKGCFNWRWHFSLTEAWRRLCFEGVQYFIAWNLNSNVCELVLFDWSSELFASISLPVDGDLKSRGSVLRHPKITLVDGGRSLGLVFLFPTQGSIWVLENSGVDTDSPYWTKSFTFASRIPGLYPTEGYIVNFLFLKKNGDMVVNWRRLVTLYNLKTNEEKTLLCNSRGLYIGSVHCYIESLLLLNG